MIHRLELEAVRDTLMDGSISHVAIRVDRALQLLDTLIARLPMTADQYIDYLIDTASQFAAGNTSIAVQPSELAALKTIIASEKAQLTLATNKNGNPA